jgi:uncharacterized protein YegP (UPF0339 family)
MAKFTLYTDKNNDFRWKFLAADEKVVARSSEGYHSKEECIKSLETLQKEIGGATLDPTIQTAPAKTAFKGDAARASLPASVAASVPAAVSAPVTASKPVAAVQN